MPNIVPPLIPPYVSVGAPVCNDERAYGASSSINLSHADGPTTWRRYAGDGLARLRLVSLPNECHIGRPFRIVTCEDTNTTHE
jgi:hypothetical protein